MPLETLGLKGKQLLWQPPVVNTLDFTTTKGVNKSLGKTGQNKIKLGSSDYSLVKNLTGSSRILADLQRPVKDPQG